MVPPIYSYSISKCSPNDSPNDHNEHISAVGVSRWGHLARIRFELMLKTFGMPKRNDIGIDVML